MSVLSMYIIILQPMYRALCNRKLAVRNSFIYKKKKRQSLKFRYQCVTDN